MMGAASLEAHLFSLTDAELAAWLESGLQDVASSRFADGAELAFSPLLLARSAPPMEQFHTALTMVKGSLKAKVTHACGLLVASISDDERPEYLRILFALAASLRPAFGVFSGARRVLSLSRAGRLTVEEATSIIDPIVAAILGYSRSADQMELVAEIRGEGLWRPKHTEQLAISLVREGGVFWQSALEPIHEELSDFSNSKPFFWKRLVSEIGQFRLMAGHPGFSGTLEDAWLRRTIYENVSIALRGDVFEVSIDGECEPITFEVLPEASPEALASIMEDVEPPSSPAEAQQRLAAAVSIDRLEGF